MKVLVFGAGDFGMEYIANVNAEDTIAGVLENNRKIHGRYLYGKYLCHPPQAINKLQFDKIVIANSSEKMRTEIFEQILSLGVSEELVGYYPPSPVKEQVDPRIRFFREFSKFSDEKNIPGNVAECGVYRGDSAKYLNCFFHDKKLYLFDTFEGFPQQDVEAERALNDSEFLEGKQNFVGRFKTTTDLVTSKLPFPDKVSIIKGYVPESFSNIDDRFCFVNLDMDLYKPMLAAMKFFWGKMSRNGGILLHDYYTKDLPGVKKAVNDFETSQCQPIIRVPIHGSMLLLKN